MTPNDTQVPSFLALGDSYTIGEGVSPEGRWPTQLTAMLREQGAPVSDPTIVARTGWTTGELAAALDAAQRSAPKPRADAEIDALVPPFSVVSLLVGVNDQFRACAPEQYAHDFTTLLCRAIQLAGDDSLHVVVLSIPDWGVTPFAEGRDRKAIATAIDEFNSVNRSVADGSGCRYVDITPSSRRMGATWLAADGLHPSAKMYTEWASLALSEFLLALGS